MNAETLAHLARLCLAGVSPPPSYLIELDRQVGRLQRLAIACQVEPSQLIADAKRVQSQPTFRGSYADACRFVADEAAAGRVGVANVST